MDESHKKANQTRQENLARRTEAIVRANEALAKSVEGLNMVLTDPEASREERLKAAELIVQLAKRS